MLKVTYKPSFFRDVKKSPKAVLSDLEALLLHLESVKSLTEISNLKKLKGHSTAYRVRLHQYRLCFFYENEQLTLVRFLPRKDVYKSFP